jgi:beta-xylosidase
MNTSGRQASSFRRSPLVRKVILATAAVLFFEAVATFQVPAVDAGGARSRPISLDSDTPAFDGDFADPSVLVVGSTNYAYSTNASSENLPVIKSTDLVHWYAIGDAMPILPTWVQGGFTWAPSVAAAPDGGYELFFTAYDPAKKHECIGRAIARSPLGPFVDAGSQPFLCETALGGAIDPSVYQTRGVDYLVWKSDGETGQLKQIFSQQLGTDDRSLVGSPASLEVPNQLWENGNIEGPALASIDGATYLFFSGNDWTSSKYAIGYIRCSSPIGPCSPAGSSPLLGSTATFVGPGSPDVFDIGSHVLLAFSAVPSDVSAGDGEQRRLYLAEIAPLGDGAIGVGD